MSDETSEHEEYSKVSPFYTTMKKTFGFMIPALLFIFFASIIIGFISVIVNEFWNDITNSIKSSIEFIKSANIFVLIISWIILGAISFFSTISIKEIIDYRKNDIRLKRANFIAVIISLTLLAVLFNQNFIDKIFEGKDSGDILKIILIVGSLGSGWFVWYLKQIKKYGEFFNVFLLTSVTGFCWYAKAKGIEEINITAVAFLVASLVRIAIDNIDESQKSKSQSEITSEETKLSQTGTVPLKETKDPTN